MEKNSKLNTRACRFTSFLKSFCGRAFVNKNGNLHSKTLVSGSPVHSNNNIDKFSRGGEREQNIYINEIRLVHGIISPSFEALVVLWCRRCEWKLHGQGEREALMEILPVEA